MTEPTYTAAETARLASLAVRGSYRVARGKGTGKVDQQIEEIRTAARLRTELEEAARRKETEARLRAAAEKRAGRWTR